MFFRQIVDPHLAQYAYLIGCQQTGEALVIDPQRDIDRYVDAAKAEGLRIVAATETHIHADFLSGARELAEQTGARLFLSGTGGPDWSYAWPGAGGYDVTWLGDGDIFRIGKIEIKALHTPGHTPEHLSFEITDRGGGADEPMGLLTGDFVFVGDLGRPDLLESAAGEAGAMEPSARRLYASVQRFLDQPGFLQVWPGHGAGSACGKALGAVPMSTVGYELRRNASIDAARRGEDAFVAAILDGQPEPPLYFGRMKVLNRDGAPVLGALPAPAVTEVATLAERATRDDAVVVDTRPDRDAFMRGHLPGALYAPWNKSFPTITGSYIRPDQAIHLIAQPDQIDAVVRDLVRIGLDRVEGYATSEALADWFTDGGRRAEIEVIDFATIEQRRAQGGLAILDVRRASELAAGHVPGAQNIAHTRLLDRLAEVPDDGQILVYCRTGARAASASALLERSGRSVALVNDDVDRYLSARRRAAG